MARQTAQQKQQQHQQEAVVLALAAVFGAGYVGYPLILAIEEALGRLRPALPRDLVVWLAELGADDTPPLDTGLTTIGPCQREEERLACAWAALYLVAAADRLMAAEAEGPDALRTAKVNEVRLFERHLAAEERRLRSAALQDATARLVGDRSGKGTEGLLGWRAVLDERTTPECRWAHGRNFRADRMPVIGWPGAVHVHCRCSAGPAIPGAPLMPAV